MAKIVCVLYDDPVDGYPKAYARDDIPKITKYPDGQTTPAPSAIDFKPGELLGSVSLHLPRWWLAAPGALTSSANVRLWRRRPRSTRLQGRTVECSMLSERRGALRRYSWRYPS
jgi:hypothetical protein